MQDLALLEKINQERNIINRFQLFVKDPGMGGNLSSNATFPILDEFTIGRDPENEILVNDPHVSAQHARLKVEGEDLYLTDLDSTNGTYINGDLIKGKQKLFPGDEIIIGDVLFEVMGWENEGSSTD